VIWWLRAELGQSKRRSYATAPFAASLSTKLAGPCCRTTTLDLGPPGGCRPRATPDAAARARRA
jgi:hypothetical protein